MLLPHSKRKAAARWSFSIRMWPTCLVECASNPSPPLWSTLSAHVSQYAGTIQCRLCALPQTRRTGRAAARCEQRTTHHFQPPLPNLMRYRRIPAYDRNKLVQTPNTDNRAADQIFLVTWAIREKNYPRTALRFLCHYTFRRHWSDVTTISIASTILLAHQQHLLGLHNWLPAAHNHLHPTQQHFPI